MNSYLEIKPELKNIKNIQEETSASFGSLFNLDKSFLIIPYFSFNKAENYPLFCSFCQLISKNETSIYFSIDGLIVKTTTSEDNKESRLFTELSAIEKNECFVFLYNGHKPHPTAKGKTYNDFNILRMKTETPF
jgi:hypothetical protein